MDFTDRIRHLVHSGAVRTSDHAYGRLQQKDISYRSLVASLGSAKVLERYPDYRHGPCIPARHLLVDGRIAHAVWGQPKDNEAPAVPVTEYWPAEDEWDSELRTRR